MANRINRTIIAMILIILSPVLAHGAIIFQDNFDSCTVNCTPVAGQISPPNSAGWGQWYSPDSATVGGVTHNSGEITSPGHGGTGKSLKMWRANGVFGEYTGALVWRPNYGVGQTHFFMSYWLKIPTAFQYTGDPNGTGFKSWRILTTGNPGEIYLNFNTYGDTWSIYDGSGWTTILNGDQRSIIWDGNWHFIEWEFGLDTNTLRLWVDDILRYENTNRTWAATGGLSWMNHFNLGNTFDHIGTWQTGWQAMELDDFVLSTTYVGHVSGGAVPPPLAKQPNPPGKILLK